jgi:hypothetical protein
MAGTYATMPRHGSLRLPSTRGKTSFTHDDSGMRAEIAREDEAFNGHTRDLALRLGLDENPHFGFTEPIDRLHRITDGEQRASVALLPAGCKPSQQLSCVNDVSWNSSISR